jgi:hypothetical protein
MACGPIGHGRTQAGALAAVLLLALGAMSAAVLASCAGVRSTSTASAAAAGHRHAAAEVRLVVTRDFGSSVLVDTVAPWKKGMTVMRLLAEHATVDTGYGGQFVSGIDGLRSSFGSVSSADAADWFYWVDGVMADVGAGAWRLHGGETVWWDYHRWAGAMFIPATLDAFPAPFVGHPLQVATTDPAGLGAAIVAWLQSAGLRSASQQTPDGSSLRASPPRTWAVIAATPNAALRLPWLRTILGYGPASGVFVKVQGDRILPLAASGAAGTPAAGVAFATANPVRPEAKLLVLLVNGPQDLPALLNGLTPESLAHHVAAYLPSGAASLAALPMAEAK